MEHLRECVLHRVLTKVIRVLKERECWVAESERETFDAAVDLLVKLDLELELKLKKEDALHQVGMVV